MAIFVSPNTSNPIRMNQKYSLALAAVLLATGPLLFAQQEDVLPPALEESPLGETAQPLVPATPIQIDGRTIILKKDGQGNYRLQDMEAAWQYDSLWLGELKEHARLFSDMQ